MYKKANSLEYLASVSLCVMGGYLLTNFYSATVRTGDALIIMGAFFWSTHIIFTGKIIKNYNLPLTIGAIQTLIVASLSLIIGLIFEDFIWSNILKENFKSYMLEFYLEVLHLFCKYMHKKIYPLLHQQ